VTLFGAMLSTGAGAAGAAGGSFQKMFLTGAPS